METLMVSIEQNEIMRPVGTIGRDGSHESCFTYSEEYLESRYAVPISLSLPLQKEPFSPRATRSFFEGLLPEGFTRRAVAQWMNVVEEDYLSILRGLGSECLGALCITAEGEKSEACYKPVSEEQVRELAAEGASKSAELVTKAHLSLTGASGKVGLYYDAGSDVWYLPRGSAPSTHIIKQSHVRLDSIVTNEQLSLMTAERCGIDVSRSFIINSGQGKDSEILFATQRYDRIFSPKPKMIGFLPRPMRLHQEDFAQALGITSAEKYEKEPCGYLRHIFDMLRRCSSDPVTDQLRFWDILVFDYLIGNTDAHLKNFSFLYSPDLKFVRLAPAYDIISTTVYPQSTRDMAFYIGGTLSLDDIEKDAFYLAAKEAGLSEHMAMQRFDRLCGQFRKALHESAQALAKSGYLKACELEERILETGGIKKT